MKRNSNIVAEVIEKRARDVKHYIKDDFSYEAALYPEAVHYLDGGIWKDINNDLVDLTDEENNKVLENKDNGFKLRIAKKSKAKKLVRIKKGEYELSWGIDNANDVQYELSNVNSSNLAQLSENDKKKALKNISSSAVRFRNILNNIDVEYLAVSDKVKENIIINSGSSVTQFLFNLSLSRLLPKLQSDGSIIFYDSNDSNNIVFRMPAPFIYDASGVHTSNVNVELINDKNKNSYVLSLTPDADWINDKDRTYPIVIDPQIETSLDRTKIQDAFVSLFTPNQNYRETVLLDVGQSPVNIVARSYIKFELPEITSSDMVIDAELNLSLYEANAFINQINAHKVLGNWESSTITWNNAPAFDDKIDDYNNLSGVVGNRFSWEITDIVKEWYTTGNNFGVVIKHNDEQTGHNKFFSSDTYIDYVAYRPQVTITYVNNSGLESYWTYHSQDLGRAGISYINDYNGNLIHVHNDINMNGNKMPLILNHVFNSNEKHINIGYGLGWRLSLNQTVKFRRIGNRDYYEYVDEDGTIHYFSYDSTEGVYRDESSIDLTLTKNADGTFSMNDKGGNLLTFNASGYLTSMKDNNNNTLTLTYSNAKIQSVTDGAGRVTTFTYDANGNLATITDPAGRKTNYSYNSNRLWRITYVDGKFSEFNYDPNNKLTSVTNIDGYKVNFSYYNASPFRVKSVQESNVDGTLGQELNMTYGNNATIFTDFTGRKNIYQFNDNGNTVGVIDNDGRAQYFKYGIGIDDRNSNKLRLQSKLQKTTINYIKNHNLERDGEWVTSVWAGNIGSHSITTEDKYLGRRSLKLTSTTEQGGRDFQQTGITLENGKTYTLSAYAKTNGMSLKEGYGAAIGIGYWNTSGVAQYQRVFINGTKDWDRYEVTFALPNDAVRGSLWVSAGIFNSPGTVYFDCFQLEEGTIANRYNLIENGEFSYGSNMPLFWDAYGTLDTGDVISTEEAAPYSQPVIRKSFKIIGDANKAKGLSQKLNITGKSGDVYVLGGWSKAESVPLRDTRAFNLSLRFEKPTGEFEWHDVYFNLDSTEWQYVSERIVAESDYVSVTSFIKYDYNVNVAYFDGLQLYKEEFGIRYQYDERGNLVSTVDLEGQTSTLQYNANDDLTKTTNPDGSQSTFNYDSSHNLLSATFAGNVVYSFTYDASGNMLTTRVGDSTLFIQESSTYSQSQNYIKTTTDSLGNIRTYNYDEVKGTLTSEIDEKNKTTTYAYDNLDRLISVSKIADGQEVKNSYTYENDRIKKITHNGFSYNFTYDSLGNLKSVDVEGQKLIENTYINRTNNLLQMSYPNGGTISNSYDDLDRLVGRSANGVERYKYSYDASGNLAYQEDLVNSTKYRYIYDLSDRLTRIIDSRKNITSFEYDLGNNISKITEQLNEAGIGIITIGYEYSQDNKQTKITLSNNKNISYVYDALGRLTSKTINTSTPHTTTFSYVPGINGSTSNRIRNMSNNGREITYTYDAKGNIKTITENGLQIIYYYNELDELIQEDNQVLNKTITYSYDVGGNLKSKLEIPYGTGSVRTTIAYTYDPIWKDKLISYNGKPITYDEVGNPLTYDVWTFRWEEGRLLAGMTRQGLDISFKYNDNGIRTEKRVNGISTRYHLINDRVTFETNGADKIYYSYDSENKLVSMNLNGVEYYYVRNAQDDIIGLLDDSGNLVVTYVYDSWGKLVSINGTLKDTVGVKNPYRYRAYRYDNETGLYYLQSRYYNPEWGRFINADNINILTTMQERLLYKNLFCYCINNPVMYSDPSGYSVIVDDTLILGAMLLIISSFVISGLLNQSWGSISNLFSRASAATINAAKSAYSTVTQALSRIKNQKNKYKYWELNGSFSVGSPISETQAISRARRGQNVLTLYSWDAKRVASIAGGGRLTIKDKPHGKNYFKHYHVGNHYTFAHVAYLYG